MVRIIFPDKPVRHARIFLSRGTGARESITTVYTATIFFFSPFALSNGLLVMQTLLWCRPTRRWKKNPPGWWISSIFIIFYFLKTASSASAISACLHRKKMKIVEHDFILKWQKFDLIVQGFLLRDFLPVESNRYAHVIVFFFSYTYSLRDQFFWCTWALLNW